MKNTKKVLIKPSTIILLVACALFIVFIPLRYSGYNLMLYNTALIYAIVVFGLSLMLGMGGQLTFAGLAFMGAGTFYVANLCSGRWGFWVNNSLALITTPIVTGLLGFLIGSVLLKLKGTYFTFSTIALVQVAYSFYQNSRPISGGPDGISNIAPLRILGFEFNNYKRWFYLLVVLVIIVALIIERIRRTRFGRSLAAIRDNETAALTLGINVYRTKVIAFAITAMLGGLAGGLYAMQGRFAGSDMFTFERSTLFIIMGMIGGINNTFGVVIGSILVAMLPEWLRSLQRYLQLIYGLSVIVLMIFMPMGLAGIGSEMCKRIKRKITGIHAKKALEEAKK